MIKATYEDKQPIIELLAKSFENNASVNYVIKQDKKKIKRIKVLLSYSFDKCLEFGEIYITDDKKGVVLTLHPEKEKTSLKTILWDIKLSLCAIGITRVFKVLKRESIIKKHHPKLLTYLWFIGVDTEHQRKGVGSKILQELIEINKKRDVPIYLETSMEDNKTFYKKNNFELYKTLDLPHRLFLFRN